MELHQSNSSSESIPQTASAELFASESSPVPLSQLLKSKGYKIVSKIKNTLQGELFRATHIQTNAQVAIKRTDKYQYKQKIAIQNDISYCVTKHIVKEALILNLLTVQNNPISDYIVKYIDFIETDADYFLVMEYIPGCINLKHFVYQSHKYIQNGTLKLKQYLKTVKYLMWQLSVALTWLHNNMSCCHLHISMESIMLLNCNFITNSDGDMAINPDISIKIGDFGVSEIFKTSFECMKHNLSLDNEEYLAPEISDNRVYNAKAADAWSLGVLIYTCITGESVIKYNNYNDGYMTEELKLSDTESDTDILISEWTQSLFCMFTDKNTFVSHLKKHHLMRYFNNNTFSLLMGLLNLKQEKRVTIINVLQHKWFKSYWKQYDAFIDKNILTQSKYAAEQYNKLKQFPFYSIH